MAACTLTTCSTAVHCCCAWKAHSALTISSLCGHAVDLERALLTCVNEFMNAMRGAYDPLPCSGPGGQECD